MCCFLGQAAPTTASTIGFVVILTVTGHDSGHPSKQTAKWISHEITDLGVSRAYMLPRFMKQAVHRLMNSFRLHKSRLDVKANHRDIKLKDECRMPNGSSWYDQIKGYGLNDRAEIDIS